MTHAERAKVADVSVVIPAWKASGTISRALSSVLMQTRLPAEIIVVDDASPDVDVLKAIIDGLDIPDGVRLQLLLNETNINGAASRNRGILAAGCGTIAFLDADDEWEPEKLALCLEAMHRLDGPVMVYSQVRLVERETTLLIRPARGIGPREHMSEYLFLSGGFVQTSTIVCPRDVAAKVQFNPAFRRHQDYDFCLRVLAEGVQPVFIEVPLVRYSAVPGIYGQRREDPEYTRSWGESMRPWMSHHGYHGFNFFLISGRLAAQRRYGEALLNAVLHGVLLGPAGLWKARSKVASLCCAFWRR